MIAQLINQLGLRVDWLVETNTGVLLDQDQHSFNVFHVPDAPGSPHIPAQSEFVEPYGIRSVLGFGGVIPTGELFAVILFSKDPIPRETADMFRTLALNVKVALLPCVGQRVFA
jgi:hypothetical protein